MFDLETYDAKHCRFLPSEKYIKVWVEISVIIRLPFYPNFQSNSNIMEQVSIKY